VRADSDAVQLRPFDVSAFIPRLHPGENVLAIHGLNTPVGSPDFLVQAELVAGTAPAQISSSAMEYTGPLPVTATTSFFIRVLDPAGPFSPYPYTGPGSGAVPVGTPWSAPLQLHLLVDTQPAAAANLVVSEIMYHPAAPTAAEAAAGFNEGGDFEFLALQNIGTTPVDLTGMEFDQGIAFTAPLSAQSALAPGARAVLAANKDAFAMRHGPGVRLLGEFRGRLDNEGDWLRLKDATGQVIKSFAYDDRAPWPEEADGTGRSLVLRQPQANPPHGEPQSWRASLDPGGELPGEAPASFSDWRRRHFDPSRTDYDAISAPLADPDADRLSNVIEYAMGLRPLEADALPLRLVTLTGQRFLEYERRAGAPDAAILAECASGGSAWSLLDNPPLPPVPNDRGAVTVRIPLPAAGPSAFYRLKIAIP
jgi:hypothetical protein